jgi:hypothetical protein
MESDQRQLRKVVVENSEAETWSEAKKEWSLLTIYDEENNCVCGHRIVENCVIRNSHNGNELVVGNVCVNLFGEEALTVDPRARASLTRLGGAEGASSGRASKELLAVALRLSIISQAEHVWYGKNAHGNGARTRFDEAHAHYDEGKHAIRTKINRLIVHGFSARRPRCACGKFAKPRQNSHTLGYFYTCPAWPTVCKFTQTIVTTTTTPAEDV